MRQIWKDMQQVRMIKDRNGNVLTGSPSVVERLKNFEDLINEENVKGTDEKNCEVTGSRGEEGRGL